MSLLLLCLGRACRVSTCCSRQVRMRVSPTQTAPPLHFAAQAGHTACLQLLLRHGALPGPCNLNAHNGLDIMLQAGADPHKTCEEEGVHSTALHTWAPGVPKLLLARVYQST
eukprot:TRINITY_DN8134_c0_g1_i1.p1 TRINITY_DN8134_c0_g1~~TRINITY_DN8134_c0_g1_i1.p1  ORF type:complete len:112 (+),score=6.80 TRINITY_DN8134_c0_g1_i1:160-495(+)